MYYEFITLVSSTLYLYYFVGQKQLSCRAETGIPTTLYFLHFPIFPYSLNPPYFSQNFHDFWPKTLYFPIFSPWLLLVWIILRGLVCEEGNLYQTPCFDRHHFYVVCVHHSYDNLTLSHALALGCKPIRKLVSTNTILYFSFYIAYLR